MPDKPSLTSSELGSLWLTYQEKTMLFQIVDYLKTKADDENSRKILSDLHRDISTFINRIKDILQNEGAIIPLGFTEKDIHKDAPQLFDNGFDIIFIRLLKEISMGMHAIHMTMGYRQDIIQLYQDLTVMVQQTYHNCTTYLNEKGLLARPPYVSMPKSINFIQDTAYMSGLNPLKQSRPLNTVEVGHIYRGIETNIVGIQLMTAFAQTAQTQGVKDYCKKGKGLSQKIVEDFQKVLSKSDIVTPSPAAGHITKSTVPAFSDKLMMYCTSLLCSFALGSNGLGTAFSLRSDLPVKMASYSKDIFDYAMEGGKLMINHGWMEEPPQMENREQLVHM
ncbi:DUF3231 family protein [Bacillus alkalicellulosilyticus]|uniref:DUF3231 family protein n=1 Tax=Alkalihalobacterium alkalicellulosilyticum TaxID=1912214 RepID=UPI00099878F0|nr:DUF3231 family protein [Bacillus alkalicellulosilyticus]